MDDSFDVFLSYNSRDKPAVREIAKALKARGIRVWLDEDELPPGKPWQEVLEEVILTANSVAVLVGASGLGPWEEPEMRAALDQAVHRKLPVIPVLLPDAPRTPDLPLFLRAFTWVDLRGGLTASVVDRLIWGITGKKPDKAKTPTPRTLAPSRARLVRDVIQKLGTDLPGVALVEPLGFGAREVVERVVKTLREPSRPELVVRLVPDPRTADEAKLYGALFRDLRHELEVGLGSPLPAAWSATLPADGASPTEESFGVALERLLDGPVKSAGRVLVLVVESLSRVHETHLVGWAYLISRLTGRFPLKVLAWGGQELFDLCTGYIEIRDSSPFQRLARLELGALTADEVRDLLTERLGDATCGEVLSRVSGGHPALVDELLERAHDELRRCDEAGLRARVLASPHLRSLRRRVEAEPESADVLRRLLRGDSKRRYAAAEERLRWLGILEENGATAWKWTASVLGEWARLWLR